MESLQAERDRRIQQVSVDIRPPPMHQQSSFYMPPITRPPLLNITTPGLSTDFPGTIIQETTDQVQDKLMQPRIDQLHYRPPHDSSRAVDENTTEDALRKANNEIDRWYDKWKDYMRTRKLHLFVLVLFWIVFLIHQSVLMMEFLINMTVLFDSTSVVRQSEACGSQPKAFITFKDKYADASTMPITC